MAETVAWPRTRFGPLAADRPPGAAQPPTKRRKKQVVMPTSIQTTARSSGATTAPSLVGRHRSLTRRLKQIKDGWGGKHRKEGIVKDLDFVERQLMHYFELGQELWLMGEYTLLDQVTNLDAEIWQASANGAKAHIDSIDVWLEYHYSASLSVGLMDHILALKLRSGIEFLLTVYGNGQVFELGQLQAAKEEFESWRKSDATKPCGTPPVPPTHTWWTDWPSD